MSYSFGDANNLKKLDFGKLKANLTKEELGIEENTFAASIFNSIDTDGNKKLSKKELNIFAKTIKELAGDDNHLSNEEAGGYSVDEQNIADMENTYTDNRINSAGERLHSKVVEFFRFINSLVEQTEGVESVKNKRKKSIIKYENGTTEIRYDDGNIIVKDANGKVIIDTKKSIEPEKGSPVTDEQYYMINYLKEQLTNAKAVMEQIENFSKDSSFAAGLTNWWYEITGKEFSRENLENLISNLEENVGLLEKAANKSPEEFARVCQEKLGINFDAQKVEDFMIQAQEFSLLQQQMSVLAKARSPRSYIGNRGHAAADAMASYREMCEMFINICQQMGYNEKDIVGIAQEALAEYNKDDSNCNLTSISFDSLQNPDNLYVMATREGGGSDVAPSEFYDLLFKKLSSRIESDMITLYDIGGEGTSADKVNKFYESKKESYNGNLSAVLGASNVEDMANTYGEELQSGITAVNGFFTTVTMVATFASGGVGFLANVAKGTNLVSKSARALSLCDKAIRVTNGANRFISVAGMVAAANPTTFFDQLFSENGMTADAFCAWGKGVLQNAAFMGSGMLASRQAMKLANCYKSKALVNLFKKGEQSFDDLMNAIKSKPQNFPPDLVKSLNSVSRASTMLQVSAETILDTIYTVSLAFSMQGDDYEFTGEDFLMSLAFAINGGVLQKELAPISDQAKARYIQDALKDFELSNDDALKIVDYLKRIDEGELTFTNGKLKQEQVLDEVEIIAKAEDPLKGIEENNPNINLLREISTKAHREGLDYQAVSDLMDKYPEYKNEITAILSSNKHIKVGADLNGNMRTDIDDIIGYIEKYPEYKNEIVDYISVQRVDENVSRVSSTRSIENYIQTLEKYPEERDFIIALSKNKNLDAKSIDGGINTIEAALNLYLKRGFSKEEILILSNQNYTVPQIRYKMLLIEKYPELKDKILTEHPEYQFIDKHPASTPVEIVEKRTSIREQLQRDYVNEMNQLKNTLGEGFFYKVKWEEIIPENATSSDIKAILDHINESSKFFARTSVNEREYGKNIQWASKMNEISECAEYFITTGNKSFDEVINFISNEYHAYDEATTLAKTNIDYAQNDRRIASGKYRGDGNPDVYAGTGFDKDGNYKEYFERFKKVGDRKSPYPDIELTKILCGDNSGMMYHPANKYVNPGMDYIRARYDELRPFIEKVKNGESLSRSDRKVIDEKIAEIYFLMANIMPYERGSNGISDILIRSIYKSLGIDQPALKQGVSLDLEAFCMDLNEYKRKWSSFFEKN